MQTWGAEGCGSTPDLVKLENGWTIVLFSDSMTRDCPFYSVNSCFAQTSFWVPVSVLTLKPS